MIQCKRAYAPAKATDGRRILVDRLWPRGCDRQGLALEAWLADLAPSTELRRAFKNGTLNFAEFRGATAASWRRIRSTGGHCWRWPKGAP